MLLVDGAGVPLSIVVSAANHHDVTQLIPTLDGIVIDRPEVTVRARQHLCADAAFTGEPAEQAIRDRQYVPHVRPRGEERRSTNPRKRPRRWVVEVAHSWFNRFRKLLVRYEKLHRSYVALNMLAAAIISFRKIPSEQNIIYG